MFLVQNGKTVVVKRDARYGAVGRGHASIRHFRRLAAVQTVRSARPPTGRSPNAVATAIYRTVAARLPVGHCVSAPCFQRSMYGERAV